MIINFFKSTLGLCAIMLVSAVSFSQATPELAPQYFSNDIISGIISHKDCAGLRFYNVVDPSISGKLTVMAIGIRADGSEIYGIWSSSTKYQISLGIKDGKVSYDAVNKSKARIACQAVNSMNLLSFSASFSTTELENLLKFEGCTGIQVSQVKSENDESFKAQAAQFNNGAVTIPSGSPDLICGNPCPSFCGNSSNYVNMN